MFLKPDAHNLLATALETLRTDLIPALPPEKRYSALMTANALAMVEREMRPAGDDHSGFLKAAAALYGPTAETSASALEKRLCTDIEAGRFDAEGPKRRAAIQCLKASVTARLAITNPKLVVTTRND